MDSHDEKKLKVPSCEGYNPNQDGEGTELHYQVFTQDEKIVSDYANIPMTDIDGLDYIDYLVWLRDGYIDRYSRTESGLKYLEACWLSEQTEPEKDKLRERYGNNNLRKE